MKTLALIPIFNQEVRIQPLFRKIEHLLQSDISECLFIDEGSQDNSLSVLNIELKDLTTPYHLLIKNNFSRAHSIEEGIRFANENDFDFLIIVNEGWEDNIDEMINIVRNKEFSKYGVVTACRHVYKLSPGSIFNILSNITASVLTGIIIRETKGDSINILNLQAYKNFKSKRKDPNTIHLEIILHSILQKEELLFSDVDNGLNFKSFLRLNTSRFLKVVLLIFSFKFSRKRV